jgi:hypothetical protein
MVTYSRRTTRLVDPEQRAATEYYLLYIRAEKPDGDLVYFLDENHG